MKRTFFNQFNEMINVVNESNNATVFLNDKRACEAFDDLSEALGLKRQSVALLVWAINHMDGEVTDIKDVASQIGYSESIVSSSLDELERHGYMVQVDEIKDALDVTDDAKALIINHYCFYQLFNHQ